MTEVKDLLLPHIRQLKTYDGVDPMEVMAQRAGIPPEEVIRLNGNENPFGPSPEVVKALGSFQRYNHYPILISVNCGRLCPAILAPRPTRLSPAMAVTN
jgi:hypothetical protein